MTRAVLLAAVLLALAVPSWAQATGPNLNHCFFSWLEGAVAENDLASFNIYIATTPGGPYTKVGSVTALTANGGTSYGPTANMCATLPAGQKYAVVKAVDTAGNESLASNEVPFVLNAAAPPAPSSLTVQ